MPRIIVFDVETRKWASDLDPENIEAGWDALRAGKGGASAICLYDSELDWCYTYDDNTTQAAAKHLEAADLIVGFRSEKFDVPVVEGLLGRRLRIRQHYDIYTEIARTNAERGLVGGKGDFTLNSVAKRNLGRGKIDHGANARNLCMQGRFGALFNYCLDDVHLTRDLFAHICRDGGLINLGGGFLPLPVPDYIAHVFARSTA
jgi:DEAD/DEAH box helicase domain-containing protein